MSFLELSDANYTGFLEVGIFLPYFSPSLRSSSSAIFFVGVW